MKSKHKFKVHDEVICTYSSYHHYKKAGIIIAINPSPSNEYHVQWLTQENPNPMDGNYSEGELALNPKPKRRKPQLQIVIAQEIAKLKEEL